MSLKCKDGGNTDWRKCVPEKDNCIAVGNKLLWPWNPSVWPGLKARGLSCEDDGYNFSRLTGWLDGWMAG